MSTKSKRSVSIPSARVKGKAKAIPTSETSLRVVYPFESMYPDPADRKALMKMVKGEMKKTYFDKQEREMLLNTALLKYNPRTAKDSSQLVQETKKLIGIIKSIQTKEKTPQVGAITSSSSSSSSSSPQPFAQPPLIEFTPGGLSGPPGASSTIGSYIQPVAFQSQYDQPPQTQSTEATLGAGALPPPMHIIQPSPSIATSTVAPSSMHTIGSPRNPRISAHASSASGTHLQSSLSSSHNLLSSGVQIPPGGLPAVVGGPPPVGPVAWADAVTKNITTSAGGGGSKVNISGGALDPEYPAPSLIGGALDAALKPSMHGMLAGKNPDVYPTAISTGPVLRDRINLPKRGEMLDVAIWGQPKDPDNATPHTWYKVAESYSNPAKLGAISAWERYVAEDYTVDLTGMLGDPFGVNFDDRWVNGNNPFRHPDRTVQPSGYVDWMRNFMTSYGVGA